MKLNGILMTVAMVVGSVASIGCNSTAPETLAKGEAAEETTSESTGEAVESSNAFVRTWGGFRGHRVASRSYGARYWGGRSYRQYHYAPYGPPASRYEFAGRAPSNRHFWSNGYHRWSGTQYVWTPGRWDTQRYGYRYVQPRYTNVSNRWQYVPGHWVVR